MPQCGNGATGQLISFFQAGAAVGVGVGVGAGVGVINFCRFAVSPLVSVAWLNTSV